MLAMMANRQSSISPQDNPRTTIPPELADRLRQTQGLSCTIFLIFAIVDHAVSRSAENGGTRRSGATSEVAPGYLGATG
jgi:hypothetical protein